MNILAIDTSTQKFSLTLDISGRQKNCRYDTLASNMAYYVSKLVDRSGIKINDIDVFVLGSGPGSFTGLRISFSFFKAVALSLNKPVICMSSFFSIASLFRTRYSRIAVFADARRNLIYGGLFRVRGGRLFLSRKIFLASLENFVENNRNYFFVTYHHNIRMQVVQRYPYVDIYPKDVFPDTKEMIRLAKEEFKNKYTSWEKMEPLYVYPQNCQVRR